MKKTLLGVFVINLLFAGLVYAADDWTLNTPSPSPSARRYHGMAYLGGDQVLLFGGGEDSGLKRDVKLDETWVYDLGDTTWTQLTPADKPAARAAHVMGYIGEGQVLLFGGWDDVDRDDETWVYDLSESTWTQKNPDSNPSARVDMDMAYIGGDQALLFGGQDDSGYDDETWIYDLSENGWTLMSPTAKPSARGEYAMAHIGGDQVLLFGGNDGSVDDETWLFDLSDSNWIQLGPAASPSARHSHAMAYMGGDQALLFGGWDGADDDETWIFDLSDTAWVQDSNTVQPSARWGFDLCETSLAGTSKLVLFGGDDFAGYDDETWTFGGGDYPMNEAPRVEVIFPNGGEIISDSVTIAWTAASPDSSDSTLLLVDLDYSDNAGGSWSVIDSNQVNHGTFGWNISGLADGADYLVRVTATDTSGLSGLDVSNAVFYINNNPQAPQATVLYPNGGEVLISSATVTWSATDPDPGETDLLSVDLDYSDNAGGSWSVIDSNQTNQGAYLWDISGLSWGTDYLIRITVTDTSGLFDSDSCDAVFTVDNYVDDWTKKDPSPHPSQRRYHRMAYAGGDEVLLYGGGDGGVQKLDETWVYDLSESTWTPLSPATKPSGRVAHAMAHVGGDRVLLFGGDDDAYDDETWVYDLGESTWTQLSPVTAPSARVDIDMAHIGGDRVLLFGGKDVSGFDDHTWIYDFSDTAWTQLSPASMPSARGEHAMAYIGGDRVLLFGGNDGLADDETWLFDLGDSTWTELDPATNPSARHSHAMAYIGSDQVLLFGGYDGADDDESWIFDLSDTAWTQDFNTTQPTPRWGFGLSATSVTGPSFPVLFGGDDAAGYDDETWTFGGGDYMLNEPPQVTVTYPNGGEILTTSAVVTWTAADPDPGDSTLLLVDLDYSDNAGASWVPLAGGEANDGAYPWDISGLTDGGSYLVRAAVTDPGGLTGADSSDAVFTVDNPGTPAAIVDLRIALVDSSLHLSWTAVTADTAGIPATVDRYVVYRNEAPGFPVTPADSIGVTIEPSYLDTTAALQNISISHFYVVRAVDTMGRRSADSNRVGEIEKGTLNHP